MSRLRTVGFEIGTSGVNTTDRADGQPDNGSGTITVQSSTVRSGAQAAKFDAGSGNASQVQVDIYAANNAGTGVLGRTYYLRGYFYFPSLPSANTSILQIVDSAAAGAASVRLTTGGKIQLIQGASTQVGSDSAATIQVNTWYRVELSALFASGTADVISCQLDGTSVATSGSLALTDNAAKYFRVGFIGAPGANWVCYVDDVALNDDQGSSQNSWPGAGSIVLAKPISDNARGAGWTGGAGGTSNLFSAVDNAPPVGLAVASATDTSQVINGANTTTQNYDANVQSYSTAGVPGTATVTLVQAVCDYGCSSSGACTGALLVVSNPTQSAEETLTATGVVAGTWPTNWVTWWGQAQVADVTLANRTVSPVLRVGKRSGGSSRTLMADHMGLYVEYVPSSFVAKERVTLSSLGTKSGSRQAQMS